jgi:20S proteasome subunit beta 1
MYVGNRCSDKLEPIHHRIYCQRSGTSSHTSTIAKYVRYYVDNQANELGNLPPVESAAAVMREIIYNNAGSLSASMICSGWDPYKGYQIYSVNQTGFFCEGDWALSGSGSTFIMGYFDANFRKDMTLEEAKEFMKSAISLACYRDGSSGGIIRTVAITKDSVERTYTPYNDFKIK